MWFFAVVKPLFRGFGVEVGHRDTCGVCACVARVGAYMAAKGGVGRQCVRHVECVMRIQKSKKKSRGSKFFPTASRF